MNKLSFFVVLVVILLGTAQFSRAATTTIDFNGSGILADSVFGFQFSVVSNDPAWSFTKGDSVPADWLVFTSPSPVQGFTLANTALKTGLLGTITYNETLYSLTLDTLVLSDLTGTPDAFVQGTHYSFRSNPDGTKYEISSVPLPSTLLLLGGGLAGIFGLKRRKQS